MLACLMSHDGKPGSICGVGIFSLKSFRGLRIFVVYLSSRAELEITGNFRLVGTF